MLSQLLNMLTELLYVRLKRIQFVMKGSLDIILRLAVRLLVGCQHEEERENWGEDKSQKEVHPETQFAIASEEGNQVGEQGVSDNCRNHNSNN